MDCVINELCYKGTILQRNYRKMTINGHFSIIPWQNSMHLLKTFWSHYMTVYPNLCYKVCYKGSTL